MRIFRLLLCAESCGIDCPKHGSARSWIERNSSDPFPFGEQERYYLSRFSNPSLLESRIRARRLLARAIRQIRPGLALPSILRSRWGKPFLESFELSFSLSYAGYTPFCLLLLHEPAPLGTFSVGMDVEEAQQKLPSLESALTPRERGGILRLGKISKASELVRRWTVKESLLKASGKGIVIDPSLIETGVFGARRGKSTVEGLSLFWRSLPFLGRWVSISLPLSSSYPGLELLWI